jgi:4-hydroxy-3-polyprenylbenzoate decarboxylase
MRTPKYIVVNDDVDITNTKEVVWAFATRNHPGSQGQLTYNDENSNPLIAYIDDAEKSSSRTTKVIYNCLDPEHLHGKLPKRSSFHFAYPAEIQQRVLDNWTSYGYSADGALKESVTP